MLLGDLLSNKNLVHQELHNHLLSIIYFFAAYVRLPSVLEDKLYLYMGRLSPKGSFVTEEELLLASSIISITLRDYLMLPARRWSLQVDHVATQPLIFNILYHLIISQSAHLY